MSHADWEPTLQSQDRGAGKPYNAFSGNRMTRRSANHDRRISGPYRPAQRRSSDHVEHGLPARSAERTSNEALPIAANTAEPSHNGTRFRVK